MGLGCYTNFRLVYGWKNNTECDRAFEPRCRAALNVPDTTYCNNIYFCTNVCLYVELYVHALLVMQLCGLTMPLPRRKASRSQETTTSHFTVCGLSVLYGCTTVSVIGACCTTAAAQVWNTHAAAALCLWEEGFKDNQRVQNTKNNRKNVQTRHRHETHAYELQMHYRMNRHTRRARENAKLNLTAHIEPETTLPPIDHRGQDWRPASNNVGRKQRKKKFQTKDRG